MGIETHKMRRRAAEMARGRGGFWDPTKASPSMKNPLLTRVKWESYWK
jgi:hypothetical protein